MVLVSEVQVSFPDLTALFGALPENISVVLYVCVLVRVCVGGVCTHTHVHSCMCAWSQRSMSDDFLICSVLGPELTQLFSLPPLP